MSKPERGDVPAEPDALFDRIVTILDEARGNVVRAVNTGMVTAYWLIGREIVEEVQGGAERAEYGKQLLSDLSTRLMRRYGSGFSVPNLQNFRKFYLAYTERVVSDCNIQYPAGTKSGTGRIQYPVGTKSQVPQIPHSPGGESGEKQPGAETSRRTGVESPDATNLSPPGRELAPAEIRHPACGELGRGFLPELSWSHYRALMRVEDAAARAFYEREAAGCGWSKAQLERQIHTAYYERIVAHGGAPAAGATDRERLPGEAISATDVLKSPYVLEFLGLPDTPELHEDAFEQAIIDNLQAFLLELGQGFAFVARQRHIRFDGEDFYIDLVFYNFILKCFLLIDLKIGKLTHRDVGQMDGYVRLFEDRFKTPDDNPTIGLILCSDKSEAVAKYSVLSEGRQIFASKYLQFLPSEEELQLEIQRERRLIESALEEGNNAD